MIYAIRKALPTDVSELERSVKPAYNRTFDQEIDDQLRGVHSMYLAFHNDRVIGTGFVRWLGPRDSEAARQFPDAPEILRLDVGGSHRSKGIGTRLITEMEKEARMRGLTQISLGVAHSNPGAYALYLKLGFKQTPIVEYYDEYKWKAENGLVESAKVLCRYLVKSISGEK